MNLAVSVVAAGRGAASQANCFNPERVVPSLSEQRRGAEACYIAVLMEQVSLPLLSWEQHQGNDLVPSALPD